MIKRKKEKRDPYFRQNKQKGKKKKIAGTETLHLNIYNCNFAYKNNICEGIVLKYKNKKKIKNTEHKIKNKK